MYVQFSTHLITAVEPPEFNSDTAASGGIRSLYSTLRVLGFRIWQSRNLFIGSLYLNLKK